MKKFIIILVHLLFSSFGVLEYCFSRGLKRFKCNLNYHYSSRIHYEHPAYQDVLISIKDIPQEPRMTSYMLCKSVATGIPQYVTWTIPLN
jgi:hypothetical protein